MKPRIRPKVRKSAASAGDDFVLTQPSVPGQSTSAPKKKVPGRPRATALPVPKAALQQPFLPGLSRRGRPRLKNPVPATKRAAASRRKRVEAGIRRIELMLIPEAAAMLDALAGHFQESRAEVVARLLTRAAKRLSPRR